MNMERKYSHTMLSMATAATEFAEDRTAATATYLRRAMGEKRPNLVRIRVKIARRSLESARDQIEAALALLRDE